MTWQAKDIPDADFLGIVEDINIKEHRWAFTWDMEAAMPEVPPKVLLAKARSLIKRGLMDGCPCGCRGDFDVTGTYSTGAARP